MSRSFLDEMQDRLSQAAEARDLDGGLTFKPMFGGVCAYSQGRVFASLSNVGLALKLAPEAQAELLGVENARRLQYEPDAPPSKHYVVVPDMMQSDTAALAFWLQKSLAFVTALPAPKQKRPKKNVGAPQAHAQ